MKQASKLLLAVISASMLTNISLANDGLANDAKALSEAESFDSFKAAKLATQSKQNNISDAVKGAIEQLNTLDADDVKDRSYRTLADDLSSEIDREQIRSIASTNELIIEFQESEMKLMDSTIRYQEQKNKLEAAYQTSAQVIEQLSLNSGRIERLEEQLEIQRDINEKLAREISSLKATIDLKNAQTSDSSGSNSVPQEKRNQISEMVRGGGNKNAQGGSNRSQSFNYLLTDLRRSRGNIIATLADINGNPSSVSEGEYIDGWKLVKVGGSSITVSRGDYVEVVDLK